MQNYINANPTQGNCTYTVKIAAGNAELWLDCKPDAVGANTLQYHDYYYTVPANNSFCESHGLMHSDGWIQLNFDWNFITEGCGDKVISKEPLYNYPICCYGNQAGACPQTQVHIKDYVNYTPPTYAQWCANNTTNTKVAVFGSIDLCSTVTNPTIVYPKPTSPCNPVLTLSAMSGDITGEICTDNLTSPFKVKVSDNKGVAKSGETIDWAAITVPKDYMGVPASDSGIVKTYNTTGSTDSSGIAEMGFKFGDLPGEYSINAWCPSCDKGSPHIFKATASCPTVVHYKQGGDTTWAKEPYLKWCKLTDSATGAFFKNDNCKMSGTAYAKNVSYEYTETVGGADVAKTKKVNYAPYTISDKGCFMSSSAMIMNWYRYVDMSGNSIDPLVLHKILLDANAYKDGEVNLYKLMPITDPPLIVGKSVNYFANVNTANNGGDAGEVWHDLNYYLSKCIPVIVKVHNAQTGSDHFVVATKLDGNGDYLINDPGGRNETTLSSYGSPLGIRVLENPKGACQKK